MLRFCLKYVGMKRFLCREILASEMPLWNYSFVLELLYRLIPGNLALQHTNAKTFILKSNHIILPFFFFRPSNDSDKIRQLQRGQ